MEQLGSAQRVDLGRLFEVPELEREAQELEAKVKTERESALSLGYEEAFGESLSVFVTRAGAGARVLTAQAPP